MTPRAWILIASLLVGTILLGCSPGGPSNGISRDDAIAAARLASPGATDVLSASTGPVADFDTGQQIVPGETKVWAVVLSGSFAYSCPMPAATADASQCPAPATSETVVIDFVTGEFLFSFYGG